MKLRDLIAQLTDLSDDLEVVIEGCDCVNLAIGAKLVHKDAYYDEPAQDYVAIHQGGRALAYHYKDV